MDFDLIASGLDVVPLLAAIEARPQLWDEITVRQDHPASAHRDTRCIWVRGPREITEHAVFNDIEATNYPAADALAEPLDALFAELDDVTDATKVGRVLIVSLKPGGAIDRHWDDGAYAAHYTRLHLPLQADPGNQFTGERRGVHMQPGELWWFNHRREHDVFNGSARERIHLIIDLVADRFPVPEAR